VQNSPPPQLREVVCINYTSDRRVVPEADPFFGGQQRCRAVFNATRRAAVFRAAGRVARLTRISSDRGLRLRPATRRNFFRPTHHTLAPDSLLLFRKLVAKLGILLIEKSHVTSNEIMEHLEIR